MCGHYGTPVNDSGIEDAYYCNLERVYDWIQHLAKPRDAEPRSAPDLSCEKIKGQDFVPDRNSRMVEALATIRLMLDIDPAKRPTAQGLWKSFQHISSQICRDCDPRSDDRWTPNLLQTAAAESGAKARRRSMQLIPEEASDNPSTENRDGPAENENLLNPYYRPDRNSLMGRRASSPHTGRHQTQPRQHNSAPIHIPPAMSEATNQFGLVDPAVSAEDGNQIRRTSSATDGRRATVQETTSVSRSMSPKKRRPLSESRPQPSVGQPGKPSILSPPILSPKRDTVSNHSPPSQTENLPVAQDPIGSSQSLSVMRQTSRSEDLEAQEKPGPNANGIHQRHEHLDSSTRIIIYDLAKKKAYVGAYAQVEGTCVRFPRTIHLIFADKIYGKDWISRPLPRSGQKFEIGEKGSPIATVDLSSLDTMTYLKRLVGAFPTLYVLNFAIQPLG